MCSVVRVTRSKSGQKVDAVVELKEFLSLIRSSGCMRYSFFTGLLVVLKPDYFKDIKAPFFGTV